MKTNNDLERTIGVLEEQGRWTAKKLEAIEINSKEMNVKIDSLLAFKWQALGALTLTSFAITGLIEFARTFH